MKVLEELTTTL